MKHLHRYIAGIIVFVLAIIIVNQRPFDSKWDRPINADGKGYYAFLPAIFIYQDMSYSFVDKMEMKYYPEDGSHAKGFRMEQPNGTVVNKCFPGTSIFYLPFFLIAFVLSWLAGFPVDGYSVLFQWAIPFAHLFYLFLGMLAVRKAMKMEGVSDRNSSIALILVVFGTNLFYYLVYDFTVAHVFGFFGACVLIYWCTMFKSTKKLKYVAWMITLMALLLITRPTNALLALIFPLLLSISDIKSILNIPNWRKDRNYVWLLIALIILFIAPLMWKIQSGNWLVYSYGNEKFNLSNPHFFEFLFSYLKGWWLWTPFMFIAFIFGTLYFWSKSRWQGVVFSVGILGVVYIFSSWWIWTFGMGFGQRPMIEFYPILIIGFAGFIQNMKRKWLLLLLLPFAFVNIIQAYQIRNFIIVGGDTTKENYWSHFLQTTHDPASVEIQSNWKEIQRQKSKKTQILTEKAPFSYDLRLKSLKKASKVVVNTKIGGKNKKTSTMIVISDETGEFYLDRYINSELIDSPRMMSFLFEIDRDVDTPIKCYIWNGNSKEDAQLESLEVIQYIPTKK